MIRTGYGIPAHDGMGAGGGGEILPPSPPSPSGPTKIKYVVILVDLKDTNTIT